MLFRADMKCLPSLYSPWPREVCRKTFFDAFHQLPYRFRLVSGRLVRTFYFKLIDHISVIVTSKNLLSVVHTFHCGASQVWREQGVFLL